QIAEVDHVEIDEAERADAGGRQVHRDRRSKTSRADTEHFRGLELALTVDADLRHDQVTRVAFDFVVRERRKVRLTADITYGRFAVSDGVYSACNRRNDADRVAGRDRCVLSLQVADVLV